MYTRTNFKTKKAFREAFEAGAVIYAYQPGGIFPGTATGVDLIEGPHYPEPHRWYCRVRLEDYRVVEILKK